MTPRTDAPHDRWMWLRWSWRDLRAHWVAVVAIALVMAIGVGVYAGLGSSATWREESNDASFAALNMHDLRVALSPGTFVAEGALVGAVDAIDSADVIVGVEERLVVDSQIDASTDAGPILVAARLVGMDLDGATVDQVWLPDVERRPGTAVLEMKFADARGLESHGSLAIAGGDLLEYGAVGTIPEDFFYEGPEGSILSQGELAPLYVSVADAQSIIGRPGVVNDVVLTLRSGADRDRVEADLERAVADLDVSATVSTRDEADAVRVLYEDIENDQRFWNALAGLVLAAAALAAFNLISRIVEAQRREIGIGMALGVPRRRLAIRPLLVGIQVAILGTIAGVGVGLLIGRAIEDLLVSFLPLPIFLTRFQFGIYARGALLGLAIPILAASIPVWRAVRVEPIEAIRTGHLTARTSRLTDWTGRLHLPGSSLTQMPIRNTLRTPRRTVLTAVGVGAAITALVAVFALLDSFGRTIDEIEKEFTQGDPDRVLVQLDTFHAEDSDVVAAVADAPAVGSLDAALRLPATAFGIDGRDDLALLVEAVDLDEAGWTPTLIESTGEPTSGVILARKAADDLGVLVGDTLAIRHPLRRDDGSFTLAQSELPVAAIHANPLRVFAYVDTDLADRFGLAGVTNLLHVAPAAGSTRADLQRDVFGLDGVTSSQAVGRIGESFDEALSQFVGILMITAGAVLMLAMLIAFNATRITVEERRREHATMRAFGVPVRSIMAVVVKESVLVGLAATVIGVGAGMVFLEWMLGSLATTTLPGLGVIRYLSPTTVAVAAIVGVVAVAVAPLFLTRRVSRMDIPDTLRVME